MHFLLFVSAMNRIIRNDDDDEEEEEDDVEEEEDDVEKDDVRWALISCEEHPEDCA